VKGKYDFSVFNIIFSLFTTDYRVK